MANNVYPAYWMNLIHGATATTSAPSAEGDGYLIPQNRRGDNVTMVFRHTATGARTFTAKIWGYRPNEIDYLGNSVSSTAGWVDTGETFSLASTTSDGQSAQRYVGLTAFLRLQVQITAISGTSATVGVAVGCNDEQGEL